MRSLKFTLPVLVALSLVFSTQSYAENAASVAPAVKDVAGDIAARPATTISRDPYYGQQWALPSIRLPADTALPPVAGRTVRVAVLDTGIDSSHEDLRGRVVTAINFSSAASVDDIHGHGTHVAGIIAAGANNGRGITGIAPDSQLLSVKVTDDLGKAAVSSLARGIRWAADSGAAVINISIEIPGPSSDLEEAVDYAWEKGAVVVAAASNHTVAPVYPAYYPVCIAVAAANEKGRAGPLLYDDQWVDVAAPGYSIYSTLPGNRYGYRSGTSFATAHVSGLAALLSGMALDRNGNGRTNDEVRSAIEKAARSIPGSHLRLIDAAAAISRLQEP